MKKQIEVIYKEKERDRSNYMPKLTCKSLQMMGYNPYRENYNMAPSTLLSRLWGMMAERLFRRTPDDRGFLHLPADVLFPCLERLFHSQNKWIQGMRRPFQVTSYQMRRPKNKPGMVRSMDLARDLGIQPDADGKLPCTITTLKLRIMTFLWAQRCGVSPDEIDHRGHMLMKVELSTAKGHTKGRNGKLKADVVGSGVLSWFDEVHEEYNGHVKVACKELGISDKDNGTVILSPRSGHQNDFFKNTEKDEMCLDYADPNPTWEFRQHESWEPPTAPATEKDFTDDVFSQYNFWNENIPKWFERMHKQEAAAQAAATKTLKSHSNRLTQGSEPKLAMAAFSDFDPKANQVLAKDAVISSAFPPSETSQATLKNGAG